LLKDLGERSSGLIVDVTVASQTARGPTDTDESDVLDFGHYSLDGDDPSKT